MRLPSRPNAQLKRGTFPEPPGSSWGSSLGSHQCQFNRKIAVQFKRVNFSRITVLPKFSQMALLVLVPNFVIDGIRKYFSTTFCLLCFLLFGWIVQFASIFTLCSACSILLNYCLINCKFLIRNNFVSLESKSCHVNPFYGGFKKRVRFALIDWIHNQSIYLFIHNTTFVAKKHIS